MKRSRHTAEQIIHKLKTAEQLIAQCKTVAVVCRVIEVNQTAYGYSKVLMINRKDLSLTLAYCTFSTPPSTLQKGSA